MGVLPYRGGQQLVLLILVTTLVASTSGCVPGCQCTSVASGKRQKGRKVDCGSHPAPLTSLTGTNFPPDTVHLNLAYNSITVLKQGSFIQLSILQKLNLSSNQITIIESGSFDGLQSLKKLDLSRNHLGVINSNMFSGLPSLEKLFISDNRISIIPDGTFNDLRSLKHIEFSSDYLRCDCHMKWILKWTKARHVQYPSSTSCALPAKMRGQHLSKLKRKDLHCDHKPQLPIFDIRPSQSQLVFQGDKLPFECHASVTPGKMEVAWYRGEQLITNNETSGVFVYKSHNLDRSIIIHRLVVESLDSSHAGEWKCVVTTATGNQTKTVHVDVRIPAVTLECPSVTNRTLKGTYFWDRSMSGLLVSQPCQKGEKDALATYRCGVDGRWRDLDISACRYPKEITHKLARFAECEPEAGKQMACWWSKQRLVEVSSLAGELSAGLVAAAQSGEILDSFDVVYLSRIMDLLLPHAVTDPQVASLLVSLVSNVSSLPQQVVDMSLVESRSPFRMVQLLEQMSQQIKFKDMQWTSLSENVAVAVFSQRQALQDGVTCVLHSGLHSPQLDLSAADLYCSSILPEVAAPVYVRIPALQLKSLQPEDNNVASSTSSSSDHAGEDDHDNDEEEDADDTELGPKNDDKSTTNISVSSSELNETESPLLLPDLSTQQPEEDVLPPEPYMRPTPATGLSNGPRVSLSPLTLSAKQIQALKISSQYFSRLSKPVNISRNASLSSSLTFLTYMKSPFNAPIQTETTAPQQTNVYVIMFRNGRLFPMTRPEFGDAAFQRGNWAVVTPVVAVSLGGQTQNVSDPVVVTFEVTDTRRPLRAAYYDIATADGFGNWRSDGCEIVHRNGSTVFVRVRHLSKFALLQDLSFVYRLDSFALEPVIFVGSGLCILCLLAIIVSFIVCFGSIGIPKKVKHAVVNVCISTVLMLVAFISGINRTDFELLCQVVGISIHYLTLCTVFWITIIANIIYKKFLKASKPPEPPPELPMPLPPKPMLQFYFVGYGVPLIICGITAAVNLHFYAGFQYCFLEWEPSLGAFYAPVTLLVAWNLVLFGRISCVVKAVTETESDVASEDEVHTNEIELLPSQPETNTAITYNITSNNTNSSNSNNNGSSNISNSCRRRYSRASNDEEEDEVISVKSLPDQERRPLSQLRSLVAMLFLFLVMWMCAALAIAKPFESIIPYQGVMFSYVYGIMSSLFGMFMLAYFCVTRKDSWLSWKRAAGCSPPETYSAPLEVTEQVRQNTTVSQPTANGSVVKSNSNSNISVYSQKSSNITKTCNIKNSSNNKLSNINIMLPSAPEAPLDENFPNFYNPRQNGAAKKFWQKHRHHSKVLNKDINRDWNGSLTEHNSSLELDQHQQGSHDTSSDGNTHLSLDMPLPDKHRAGSFSGSKQIPVHSNNYHHANHLNFLGSNLAAVTLEDNSKVLGFKMPALDPSQTVHKAESPVIEHDSNSNLPQHQRSPSAGSLGVGVHQSAFTPVQPRNNNTIPRQSKQDGDSTAQKPEESLTKNQLTSSLNHKLDGPAPATEIGQRPPNPGVAWNPLHCNLPPLPNHPANYSFTPPPLTAFTQQQQQQQQHYPFDYSSCPPPHPFGSSQFSQQQPLLPVFNIPPSPYLMQSQSRAQVQSMSPGSSSSQSQSNRKQCHSGNGNGWYPMSAGDSSDSSKPPGKRATHVSSPRRTVTYAPHSPVLSESQSYEPAYVSDPNGQEVANKVKVLDSDHHSDPTHRKKQHRSDRHSRTKLSNRQRSLGWEEQFKDRPSKINYVYVNHVYKDKVMHKLIKQASESDDLAKKAFWLPRTASEYERLTQRGFSNMADDSSSTSVDDDSLDDNVWVRQSSGSDFNKKETSV